MWEPWPLALVGSLAYIAGQPVGTYLGPYLPDVAGAIVCFVCLLLLLEVRQPKQVRGCGDPQGSRGFSFLNADFFAAASLFNGTRVE
jgi:L-lactate permease